MSQCRSRQAWYPESIRCARRSGHHGKHRCEDAESVFEWGKATQRQRAEWHAYGISGRSVFTIYDKAAVAEERRLRELARAMNLRAREGAA